MNEIIMSYIFSSHYAIRSLESIGSGRPVHLVDNSFNADLRIYAGRHPHIDYIRPKIERFIDIDGDTNGSTRMEWFPLTCAESWNLAMERAQTQWVININPDMMCLPQTLQLLDIAVEQRMDDVVLMRGVNGFNVWMGDRAWILENGGFDTRFKPCAGEDEDMLVRIGKSGKKWQRCGVAAYHQDGGHKDRVDVGARPGVTYCNSSVFKEKWGWIPNSPEYKKIVGAAHAGGL